MSSQNKTPGTELSRLMDVIGFPDHMCVLYGTMLDQAIRNDIGVARNVFNAFSGFRAAELDKIRRSTGFAEAAHCPNPVDVYKSCANQKQHYYDRKKIGTLLRSSYF